MIDKLFDKLAVKIALVFVVLELSYVNSKSLLYLVHSHQVVDCFFSIVGATAFSMVTVIVMRKSDSKTLKVAFPLFDIALMFCGLNIEYADVLITGNDNFIRFALTVFLSLFTGLITYSLGFINRNDLIRYDTRVIEQGNHDESTLLNENYDTVIPDMLHNAIRYEAWMVRKKSESVRNDADEAICALSNRIKAGGIVSIEEYMKIKHLNN